MRYNVLASIGNTPLIRLNRLTIDHSAEIWVKWEGANPTGCMKDRMGLSMIEGAERRGELKPEGRVVEYTGGSTGSSLAMVCAAKGYRAYMVSSDAFSEEKLRTMRAFGATVEIIPSEDRKITQELIQAMIDRAGELAKEPNPFSLRGDIPNLKGIISKANGEALKMIFFANVRRTPRSGEPAIWGRG